MVWLVGGAIFILLVASAGFRKLALGLVAMGVAVAAVIFVYSEREDSRSLSRIPIAEVVFENAVVKLDKSSYKISGRVKNNSPKFTLTQLDFIVTLQDCAGASTSQNCITIGESNQSLYITIPPGQARDFDEFVNPSGGALNPKGRLRWQFSISQTKGE